MGTLSCGCSLSIYRYLVCIFFIKTLIIMYISIIIHGPYVCDPLGPYISLVNNSIDLMKFYWSTLINYPYQYIDSLIKDRFNPIDSLSFQLVGCQATPRTLGDMDYIRTLLWNLYVISYHLCIILHPHEAHE